MRTRAQLYRHPIHPMLVVFPIALWIFSFICDIAANQTSNGALWSAMAFYTMAGGVIGALAAAVPGFIDYLGLKQFDVKRIATAHLALNLVIVVFYVFNLGFRMSRPAQGNSTGMLISAVSLVLLAISGWLGGSMVYEHGVGVEPTAINEIEKRDRAA